VLLSPKAKRKKYTGSKTEKERIATKTNNSTNLLSSCYITNARSGGEEERVKDRTRNHYEIQAVVALSG